MRLPTSPWVSESPNGMMRRGSALVVLVGPVGEGGTPNEGSVAVPAPRKAPAITDCPAVLDRPEAGDRVIAGSCAPVTVRKGYRVESGSLTLEAGVAVKTASGTSAFNVNGTLLVQGTAAEPVV